MKRIDRYIRCYQGMIDQDTLFIVPQDYNAICKVDLQQKKARIETWLDDKNKLAGRLFFSVILSDGWLVLAPGESDQVLIYHLETGQLKRIDICNPRVITNEVYFEKNKFFCGFFRNGNVYLLATTYPAILKINIDTGEATYIVDWIEEIRDRIPMGDTNWYFSPGFVFDGNYAYISGSISGTIVRLDCSTDKTRVFKSSEDIKMLHGIITYKEDIWVLADTEKSSNLFRWIPEKGFFDGILIEPAQERDVYWCSPLEIDGSIYLFQSNGINVYKVDMQEKKVIQCTEITEAIGKVPQIKSRMFVRLIGEYKKKIIFMIANAKKWFEYDTISQTVDCFIIETIDDEYERRYMNNPYMEESDIPLSEFLEAVTVTDGVE